MKTENFVNPIPSHHMTKLRFRFGYRDLGLSWPGAATASPGVLARRGHRDPHGPSDYPYIIPPMVVLCRDSQMVRGDPRYFVVFCRVFNSPRESSLMLIEMRLLGSPGRSTLIVCGELRYIIHLFMFVCVYIIFYLIFIKNKY